MKPGALFIGCLAGTVAAVAAFVLYDWMHPGFHFLQDPDSILFPLVFAGAQAFFLGLPLLFLLNRIGWLNWVTATFAGVTCAALPWVFLFPGTSHEQWVAIGWIAVFGAVGGIAGYAAARGTRRWAG